MSEVVLTGLDGSNPLGFLAALGVLRVLDDGARAEGGPRPTLLWREEGRWLPVVGGVGSVEEVVERVMGDLEPRLASRSFGLRYLKVEKEGPKMVYALRAPVPVLRAHLEAVASGGDEREWRDAVALLCEVDAEALDEKKQAGGAPHERSGVPWASGFPAGLAHEPPHWDFTSRNTQFLDQLMRVGRGLTTERAREELSFGLATPEECRSMDWDPDAEAPGALFSGYQRRFRPASEWLAGVGIGLLPSGWTEGGRRSACCRGKRKNGEFVWPLWTSPLCVRVLGSLLCEPLPERSGDGQRSARGVAAVYAAALTKASDGYGGAFGRSEPR